MLVKKMKLSNGRKLVLTHSDSLTESLCSKSLIALSVALQLLLLLLRYFFFFVSSNVTLGFELLIGTIGP